MNNTKKRLSDKGKIIIAVVITIFVILSIELVGWIVLSPSFTNKSKQISLNNKSEYEHKEPEIVKEEKISNIEFKNIALTTQNGYTTFTADVTNTGTEKSTKENFNIDLVDEDNNVVITLIGNIPDGLEPKETKTITASAKGEFQNVKAKTIRE